MTDSMWKFINDCLYYLKGTYVDFSRMLIYAIGAILLAAVVWIFLRLSLAALEFPGVVRSHQGKIEMILKTLPVRNKDKLRYYLEKVRKTPGKYQEILQEIAEEDEFLRKIIDDDDSDKENDDKENNEDELASEENQTEDLVSDEEPKKIGPSIHRGMRKSLVTTEEETVPIGLRVTFFKDVSLKRKIHSNQQQFCGADLSAKSDLVVLPKVNEVLVEGKVL